jgi:hypothetical protein
MLSPISQVSAQSSLAPIEHIAPHILRYWKMHKTDVEILQLLHTEHIDLELYGFG